MNWGFKFYHSVRSIQINIEKTILKLKVNHFVPTNLEYKSASSHNLIICRENSWLWDVIFLGFYLTNPGIFGIENFWLPRNPGFFNLNNRTYGLFRIFNPMRFFELFFSQAFWKKSQAIFLVGWRFFRGMENLTKATFGRDSWFFKIYCKTYKKPY